MTRLDVQCIRPSAAARPVDRVVETAVAGSWELVRLAAEGSLARVYQARPAGASAECRPAYAVKILHPQWQVDARAVALIRREAQVGQTVAHPHLVSVLAAHVGAPPYYLVMPWLDGKTLGERLRANRPFPLPTALWIARQVAEGLAALDDAGWIHGDVKPANVVVSAEGHVTLLDLGFARRPDESGSAVERCVLGTVSYMAPETITSALRTDIRSDIYSLGVVLYQILAGRLPFRGQTLAELAQQQMLARPSALRKLLPALPGEVAELVHSMLAKEPLRRPQTPRELIGRLAELEIATFGRRG